MTLTAGLLLIAIAVGIFLTVLLGLSRRVESRILAALTALLLAISVLQLTVALQSDLMLYLPFAVFPSIFMQGLLIDLYTRRILGEPNYGSRTVLAMCLPAFAAFFLQLFMFTTFPEFRDVEAVYRQRGIVKTYTSALFIFALVYNLVFIVISARKLPSALAPGKNSASPGVRLRWLKIFLIFNAVLCVAGLTNVFYNLFASEPAPVNPLTAVLFSGGNYLILTFLIRRPAIFAVSEELAAENQKGKYAKIQSVDENTRKQYILKIQKFLMDDEAFLDDSLGLNDLSEELGIAPHLVSMVINLELRQNFYTLVNSYRVEKAKELLLAEAQPNILEVAYASGFQSKSAFNRVFKQFTGKTPSAFRSL